MGGPSGRSSRRRHVSLLVAVGLLASMLGVSAQAQGPLDPVLGDPGLTYPDLVPDVTETFIQREAIGFDQATQTFIYGPPTLYFDTYSQNLGTVALDLISDEPTNVMNPAVSQCVSWYTDLACRERRTVGGFELHPTHGHFHYNDFASYQLRRLATDGSVDYSAAGLIDTSDKVSFCLIDSTTVRDDARPIPTYVGCGSTREGISAGWADIYTSDLDGQQLSLAGLSDGRYALVTTLDTADHVYESDDTNNRIEVIIELANAVNTVQVVERRWPTLGGGGPTTTTTTTTTTTSTSTTSTSTTSTTTPCASTTTTTTEKKGKGGGGGNGGGGGGGGGGGNGKKKCK